MGDDKLTRKAIAENGRETPEEVERAIDAASPGKAARKQAPRDLDAHVPADKIPGPGTQEPMKHSQREDEDGPPGT